MSSFIIGILTVFLVLNSLLLILLVLVQLPKKDAGAGLAFGSGAADALFGAGSGNALTKITKYATIVFLVMAVFLGFLWDRASNTSSDSNFANQVSQQQAHPVPFGTSTPAPAPSAPAVTPQPATPQLSTNRLSLLPVLTGTNSAAGTNSAK
jgi:protein translocase SecG subunit